MKSNGEKCHRVAYLGEQIPSWSEFSSHWSRENRDMDWTKDGCGNKKIPPNPGKPQMVQTNWLTQVLKIWNCWNMSQNHLFSCSWFLYVPVPLLLMTSERCLKKERSWATFKSHGKRHCYLKGRFFLLRYHNPSDFSGKVSAITWNRLFLKRGWVWCWWSVVLGSCLLVVCCWFWVFHLFVCFLNSLHIVGTNS